VREELPPREGAERAGLRIRLLGGFEIARGASVLDAGSFVRRKPVLLVKLLALQSDHALHRDQVVEALWPDLAPAAAVHQLYNAISHVRKVLRSTGADAAGSLAFRRGRVRLHDPAGVSVDVVRFLAAAVSALQSGRVDHLRDAIAAYGGPLLPDDLYEPWSTQPRAEVHETYGRLRLALAQTLLEGGGVAEARALFEAVVRDDATEERAYRGLMRADALADDLAGVERTYARCGMAIEAAFGEAPSEETQRLRATLVRREPARPMRGRLPEPATTFVGRQFELAEVGRRLAMPGCRWLTLTGIGGIGKTRLALAAARAHAAASGRDAALIALPDGSSPEQVVAVLAEALDVPLPEHGDREAALVAALAPRALVVVLDNAEHAIASRSLLSRLSEAAPRLTVVAASRQRLELQGEWVFEVHGLEVPRAEAGADASRFGAVQLFLERARHAGSEVGRDDAVAVGRICRILHGVPLALELAASWVGVLSCGEIVAHLERGLDLLVTTSPDVPERHRSLRHAFDQSWRLLDDEERRYLARLAVFAGAFTVEAAQQVVQVPLPILRSLATKSLVTQPTAGRCAIHPVVQQFAGERLAASDALSDVRGSHRDYYLAQLAGRAADLEVGAERAVMTSLRADIGDFRAAWRYAVESGDVTGIDRAVHGIFVLFEKLGWAHEGLERLDAASAALRARPRTAVLEVVLARVEARAASFEQAAGRIDTARERLQRSLGVLRRAGDDGEVAFALDKFALLAHQAGDDGAAEALLHEALGLRRRTGDADAIATSLNNVGSMAFARGELDEAERWCGEALALQRRTRAGKGAAISLQNLASIAAARGDAARAEALLLEGLALARVLESASLTAVFLASLGRIVAARGDVRSGIGHVVSAIEAALEVGAEALATGVLPVLASLLHQQGRAERAVELWTMVIRSPVAGHDLKRHAEEQLLRVARDLAPHAMAAAQARASARRLRDVAAIVA
jgi:predicted ATPase/DNA-binding SARP family transcriptional activator